MDDLLNSIKNQIEDREQLEQDLAEIRSIARQDGETAAGWYWDRTEPKQHDLITVLKGMDDVDPAVMDTFQHPDWSGEWADNMNWEQFCEAHFDRYTDAHAEMCDDYNERYMTAYEDALRKDIFRRLGGEVILELKIEHDCSVDEQYLYIEAIQHYPALDRLRIMLTDEGESIKVVGYKQDAPDPAHM